MIKRTLWYAFLVLLCCGTAALVVNATTVGKTSNPAPKPATLTPTNIATDNAAMMKKAAPVAETETVVRDARVEATNVGPAVAQEIADSPALRAKAIYNRWLETGMATPEEKALLDEYYFSNNRGGSGRSGHLDDSGGPDAFGYRFKDNLAPDTATYNWIELRGDPGATWISAWASFDDGCASAAAPIGFSFPFYGTNYTTFTPTSNGQISFGTCYAYAYYSCVPNASVGPAIFPFLYDLHLQRGGIPGGTTVVGYKNFGTYTVIEFDSIGYYSSSYTGSSLKFQVILYDNGRIKLQYNNMVYTGSPPMGTVGIQNNAGAINLQYRCYTDANTVRPLSNGRAIWFYASPAQTNDFTCTGITSPGAGSYQPSQVVNVTANFRNAGTATQSSPVKYRFNNGAIQTEATAVLPQNGTESHTFALPITMPGAVGDYPLLVWSDLASDQDRTNDTARVTVLVRLCADFTVTAPGVWTGSTVGAGDNCALRTGDDHIYQVTIPYAANWEIKLCEATYYFDTYLFLTDACCGGTVLAQNDDGCSPNGLQSIITAALTPGTYFVDIEPYSSGSSGNYTLTIQETEARCCYGDPGAPTCVDTTQAACTALGGTFTPGANCTANPCPIAITCPPGGIQEGEPDCADEYVDSYNGGCNSTPNIFQTINCGDVICGKSGTFLFTGLNYRDTDWFTLTTTTPQVITWSVQAEFPLLIFTINSPCPAVIRKSATAPQNGTATIVDTLAAPGTYYLWIGPSVFSGVACGADYVATLTCQTYVPPTGRCCYGNPVQCVVNTQAQCAALSGTWTQGLDCSTPCPSCVDFSVTAPGVWTGNTLGAGNDCNLRTTEEHIYAVTIPNNGNWTIKTCETTYYYDTYLYLTSGCCSGIITQNDDGCSPNGLQSIIQCYTLTAGTYYVAVEGFSGAGQYTLTIEECTPCIVECQPGDVLEPAENPADTTHYRTDPNGGCNNESAGGTATYSTIQCGETVCGRGFTYAGPGGASYRDTDWWLLTITQPESLRLEVTAEFPVLCGIVDHDPCATAAFLVSASSTTPCTPAVAVSACLQPGSYVVFVSPSVFTGFPTPLDYRATLTCIGCTPPTPPANDECATAELVAIVPNGQVVRTGSTALANASCQDVCDYTSTSNDVFYRITLTQCRKIAMALTAGDMHISVYDGAGNCCVTAAYCNDDDGNFTPLPPWDVPAQHPGGLNSYIAAELTPGTWYIRVGYYSSGSGPYTLTIYDNGSCVAPCDPVANVTNYLNAANTQVIVRWNAPVAGQYKVYSSIVKNNDGNPDEGADTDFVLEATVPVAAPGAASWTDPAAPVAYKNYVVVQFCP